MLMVSHQTSYCISSVVKNQLNKSLAQQTTTVYCKFNCCVSSCASRGQARNLPSFIAAYCINFCYISEEFHQTTGQLLYFGILTMMQLTLIIPIKYDHWMLSNCWMLFLHILSQVWHLHITCQTWATMPM